MRVRATNKLQYGYPDHRGDPQLRVIQPGEEFDLIAAEHFSLETMEPVDDEARAAQAQRTAYVERRMNDSLKAEEARLAARDEAVANGQSTSLPPPSRRPMKVGAK